MRWQIIKAFSAKIGNEHQTFHSGDKVELANDKATKLLLAGVIAPTDLEGQEHEYFTLLAHWWDDATEELPDAEVERMLSRLDTLYRELHRQGCRVPVRLPVEKNNSSAERRGEDHSTWTLSN